jgi:hypothetical protein
MGIATLVVGCSSGTGHWQTASRSGVARRLCAPSTCSWAKAGGAIGIMSLKRIDDRFVLHALATNRRLRASAPRDLRQSLEFPHQAPSDLRNSLVT